MPAFEGNNMICKQCGKKMIKRDIGIVLTSCPPQYSWYWWCGCGHIEEGGTRRGKTEEEMYLELWAQKNAE